MNAGARTLLKGGAAPDESAAPALPLGEVHEPLVETEPEELPEAVPLEPARALVLAEFEAPRTGPVAPHTRQSRHNTSHDSESCDESKSS